MRSYFHILAVLLGMILITLGCNGSADGQVVDFKIDVPSWLNASAEQLATTDHYGVLVVDVLEKQKSHENMNIQPKDAISFPLIKHHTYYILLISYDESNEVLSFAEKELKI